MRVISSSALFWTPVASADSPQFADASRLPMLRWSLIADGRFGSVDQTTRAWCLSRAATEGLLALRRSETTTNIRLIALRRPSCVNAFFFASCNAADQTLLETQISRCSDWAVLLRIACLMADSASSMRLGCAVVMLIQSWQASRNSVTSTIALSLSLIAIF